MLIMIRVRALAYLLLALAEGNEYQQTCILQANPKPNPLSITMVLITQALLSFLALLLSTFMPEMHQFKAIPSLNSALLIYTCLQIQFSVASI